ncbi:MAG: reactive intermediate/imine deaminase [Lysobacterales bacterium CG17_big_fil_post_rev_8_21_14_2_50_64_11]|nr:MAG: reactive intermediate/imine deaminase [Xanthomonadales bacterium CG17_big_fil_post_rev_8_21_14_2_50_64_11]PIX59542.1 MAG: reactive intermediate/imine deaminase [Xanthomonadales bacterium CG_4_10_14_3_um_filter_64_11]
MPRQAIATSLAPAAIGPYSQAVRCGNTVYLSGQIPLDPATGEVVAGDIRAQATRVFENLRAVITAAGGSFDDVARVGIYLTDLGDFAAVNAVMADYFSAPYPARSTIEVSALPRAVKVEVDAIVVLG